MAWICKACFFWKKIETNDFNEIQNFSSYDEILSGELPKNTDDFQWLAMTSNDSDLKPNSFWLKMSFQISEQFSNRSVTEPQTLNFGSDQAL